MTTSPARHWTFLSNHAHVLVCLAQDPDARLRDVALSVGITERAVQKIVDDLEDAGVVTRERSGRRNRYRLNVNVPLRHPLEAHRCVGSLLAMVLDRNTIKRIPPA
jgi:DNA-binding transcriptional ArsR family regulator